MYDPAAPLQSPEGTLTSCTNLSLHPHFMFPDTLSLTILTLLLDFLNVQYILPLHILKNFSTVPYYLTLGCFCV